MYSVKLERCRRGNTLYQQFRGRHYIPNNGAGGQQLHYLIIVDGKCTGIISGGSAAYAVKARDEYFGITKDNRNVALNGIVDNTVFRLEMNVPNLATQIMKIWRKTVTKDWYEKYGVRVAGFETFVIENEHRKGTLYKADNWDFVGETLGNTKFHQHGIEKAFTRREVEKKLIFCKWNKNGVLPESYIPTWNLGGNIKGQITIDEWLKDTAIKAEII